MNGKTTVKDLLFAVLGEMDKEYTDTVSMVVTVEGKRIEFEITVTDVSEVVEEIPKSG